MDDATTEEDISFQKTNTPIDLTRERDAVFVAEVAISSKSGPSTHVQNIPLDDRFHNV
jgi:hypothetical protein